MVVDQALLVASGALLKHAWFPAYPLHRIYYPPLGLEQREKVRKARDRLPTGALQMAARCGCSPSDMTCAAF
ncbi:hypothetical protein KKQ11_07985 [Pseudomonas sp. MG-2]|uniref:hypothetical protein n=1 Tax=Pseudomonas sp. MG-2 TaxID=405714 RepID=UPI001BFFE38E|nr:hypothetical protein [Pseudomonas sp. MG-2]MBT9235779.1 hypothetical protein [Pseudomonas sp. MG-2]